MYNCEGAFDLIQALMLLLLFTLIAIAMVRMSKHSSFLARVSCSFHCCSANFDCNLGHIWLCSLVSLLEQWGWFAVQCMQWDYYYEYVQHKSASCRWWSAKRHLRSLVSVSKDAPLKYKFGIVFNRHLCPMCKPWCTLCMDHHTEMPICAHTNSHAVATGLTPISSVLVRTTSTRSARNTSPLLTHTKWG